MPSTIHVFLPAPLRVLAKISGDVVVQVPAPVTAHAIVDAIEAMYPALRGTIRESDTRKRRPLVRFFACEQDLSHEPMDTPLPNEIASGREPFYIIGAIAGG